MELGYFFMPNRVLRDWTTSEAVNQLSFEAEVFFTRLIMKADDHGNYTANPKLLNAALFPLKDLTAKEVEGFLAQCVACGVLSIYQVDGKQYVNIPNFGQRLRQMRSSYPQPADNPPSSGGQVSDNGRLETKRSRNEVETESEKTRAWFDSCLDDIFRETLAVTHKGKNVNQAISEAWVFLSADKSRLRAADSSDVKKLVNTWLGNMKGEKQEQKRVKLL